MSNFIYNDNFSQIPTGGDNDPVKIYIDKEEPRGFSRRKVAIICVLCMFFSCMFGLLGGYLVSSLNSTGDSGSAPPPAYVQTNTIYKSSDTGTVNFDEYSRADVIEKIKDCVVEIQTQYVVKSYYQYVTGGAGSGVIVGQYDLDDKKAGYYVITNAHVVEGANANEYASTINVILTDGTEYDAMVKGYNPTSDIAILMIAEAERELACATFANESYKLRVGDQVMAIGNPLGELGGTVTNGYISALDREIEIDGNKMNLLQTDAAINPGNSGGGLFNMKGELVGIVNAKSSGTGIEGLGFAIPVDDALKIFNDYINKGYVTGRPTIYANYILYGKYVTIKDVIDVGENDNSEILSSGDRILAVVTGGANGYVSISSVAALDAIIRNSTVGDTINLYIYRSGKYLTVGVTIYEYAE
ncbi:MAG: trypsin-like peptidase domain-containing protein [Clostridia bacterium]|nr:trypsin-like peptidase domain-containing protein [Clostridia bacterium]